MSRLTALMARRLGASPRTPGAGSSETAARPLGFERFEQRIALSTNAAWTTAPFEVVTDDGGAIQLVAGAVAPRNSTLLFDVFVRHSSVDLKLNGAGFTNSFHYKYDQDVTGALVDAAVDFNGSNWSMETPEVLVADSRVTPIPPPEMEGPASEGGQISMAPFVGPSLLGLATSRELSLAEKQPQLAPASVSEQTPAAPHLAPAETLRGRAVVYEVAQARAPSQSAAGFATLSSSARAALQVSLEAPLPAAAADVRAAAPAPQEQNPNEAAIAKPADHLALLTADVSSLVAESTSQAAAADRIVTEAALQPGQKPSAQDAALEQLYPNDDVSLRQSLIARFDGQERRLAGGVLVAVAAIPAAKAMRRSRQQAYLMRPRRAR